MAELQYRETMRAQQQPDVYGGSTCDEHRPRWSGCAEGDMDGPSPIGKTLSLDAEHFPPGTKVLVLEPECPSCGAIPFKVDGVWKCECAFDWHSWTEEQFS